MRIDGTDPFATAKPDLLGVAHYAAHCAVCHGAPGVPKGDIGRGLYPPPPDLARTAPLYTPAELFWTVKHGIKMTGMPAWSDHTSGQAVTDGVKHTQLRAAGSVIPMDYRPRRHF